MESQVRTLEGTRAARILRAELMAMAGAAARDPSRTRTLRLVHPGLSETRLQQEWSAAAEALRPEVLALLSVQAVFPDGHSRVFGGTGRTVPHVGMADDAPRTGGVRLPSRDLSFVVEKLLVWAWLTRSGPLTRKWLEGTAGCSYPTVASVVRRLGSAVHRHPDRRIELRYLPHEEWSRLLAFSGEARSVMRFADRSGRPSTAAAMLRRLATLPLAGVAVGGVAGARHYHPDLDLVGLPRLDLSVHCPGRSADVGFVEQLDSALKELNDPGEPAQLVLHFVRHKEPLFTPSSNALPWADPIECLLDLHEARLEAQALEFLEALKSRGPEAA